MLRYGLLFFLLCFVAAPAFCQIEAKGRVFEYNTHIAIPAVQVQDVNSKLQVLTDSKGVFSIKVKVGDLLTFTNYSYKVDSVVITNANSIDVYLLPKQNMLNGITVNAASGAPSSFKTYDPEFHGQTMQYQRDANGNYKGGVSFRIPDWKKDENKKARDEKMEADDKLRDKIATEFNEDKIGKYVPLKGKELTDFVVLYMPDIKVYTSKEFNLLAYVNTCYQEFVKLPPEKRLIAKLDN